MSDRINQALTKLFNRHRIVFWYDAKRELRGEFEALELDCVEKMEIAGNDFGQPRRNSRSGRAGAHPHQGAGALQGHRQNRR